MRGSPHAHYLLWIKDAPIPGEAKSEDIIKFIEQHISAELPREDDKENATLRKRILDY